MDVERHRRSADQASCADVCRLPAGVLRVLDQLGRRPVRAVRRRVVLAVTSRLGAVVEPRTGVPPLPRQPLQGARPRRHRHDAFRRRAGQLIARVDWPLVFAVDASTWDRCDAECSPERGFYYSASKHSAGQPIVAGWCYQWICQLNWAPDSWTAPLDVCRIPPTADTTDRDGRPGPPARRTAPRRR